MKYLLLLLTFGLLLTSCAKKKAEKQAIEDEDIIQAYIAEHNLDAIPTGSGLYYVIETEGGGAQPTSSSDVRVAYTGSFTDGEVFEESDPAGIEFNLAGVIQGWQEGIPFFKEGGSGKLLIPSALAYGPSGSGSIPGNTVLIFDVELLQVY